MEVNPLYSDNMSQNQAKAEAQQSTIAELEKKALFDEAMVSFHSKLKSVTFDKKMSMGKGSPFSYVSHAQLLKTVNPILAECGLYVFTRVSCRESILSVTTYLKHKGGHAENTALEFDLPKTTFANGIAQGCTQAHSQDKTSIPMAMVNSMKFYHELGKGIGMLSKYTLQSMLAIAGGEIDSEESTSKRTLTDSQREELREARKKATGR